MSRVTLYNPPNLAPAVGFAHAAGCGDWVWLGGQISSDESGRVLHPGDLTAQFAAALRNVVHALAAADCRPEDVVKLTYFVTDVRAYREGRRAIGTAYRATFGRHYPASSLFEVKGLYEPEAMVEIEAIACRSAGRQEAGGRSSG